MKFTKKYGVKDKKTQLNTAEIQEKKLENETMLCQLESISTKQSLDSVTSVLTVRTPAGKLCSLKRTNELEPVPAVGSILFVELDSQETDASSKVLSILDMKRVTPLYELSYLELLFKNATSHKDLVRLLEFIDRLNDKRIKQLLIELFQDSDIAIPFITFPASHNHHHSYAGGLLEHSLECAEWTENTAYSAMTTCEAELTLITALLHDIGKIKTMERNSTRQLVPHETFSLLLLEPLITKLQIQWEQGADVLRAMLSFSMTSTQFPQFPGILLVKMADQFSTSISARKMAFQDVPDYFYFSRLKTSTATQFFNRLTVS